MAFWLPLAGLAAGALMGAQRNKREQEIEDADKKLVAASQRYSYATGNAPESIGNIRRAGSSFANIGQGALSGAMFASQFNNPTPQKSFWEELRSANSNPYSGVNAGGMSPYQYIG